MVPRHKVCLTTSAACAPEQRTVLWQVGPPADGLSVVAGGTPGRLLGAVVFFGLDAVLVIGFLEMLDALPLLWRRLGGHGSACRLDYGVEQTAVAAACIVRLLATVVGMDHQASGL
jgi:hypothetical protein